MLSHPIQTLAEPQTRPTLWLELSKSKKEKDIKVRLRPPKQDQVLRNGRKENKQTEKGLIWLLLKKTSIRLSG